MSQVPLYGHTRSLVRRNYSLLEPGGLVPSVLPGWDRETCLSQVVIGPAMGAKFTQTHVTFQTGGTGQGATGETELFAYVVTGAVDVVAGGRKARLESGGYVFVPPSTDYAFSEPLAGTRLVLFAKRFVPLPGTPLPPVTFGRAADVPGNAYLGDPALQLQVLLPDIPAFDLAVNIFTYAPGGRLPFVETHVMEHGLVMLAGEGVYRLEDEWFPVREDDIIWMGPYCPQWFCATGPTPAAYLYYKDVNRPLL
jgi:(S)-ureidoglycine aminohydrolase